MGSEFLNPLCRFAVVISCRTHISSIFLRNGLVVVNKVAPPFFFSELCLVKRWGPPVGPALYSFHVLLRSRVLCICQIVLPITRPCLQNRASLVTHKSRASSSPCHCGLGILIRLNRFFQLRKNRNRSNRFLAIYCDLLRFIAIFPRKSKLDTGKRLKRNVKIYSLHGLPLGTVESSK